MTRVETMRNEILCLCEKRPFSPFEIKIENGDRVVIEHPENILLGPRDSSSSFTNRLHAVHGEVLLCTTLDAVTSVMEINRGEMLGGDPDN